MCGWHSSFFPLSEYKGSALGELQLAPVVGRIRDLNVFHRFITVLVLRSAARPGNRSGSCQNQNSTNGSMVSPPLAGPVSRKTGSATNHSSLVLAGLSTPLVLSVHTIVSFDFATSGSAGMAYHHLPALFRCRCDLLRVCHGANPDDRGT